MIKDFESAMAVGISQPGDPTRKNAKSNDIIQQTTDSSILTLLLPVQKSDLYNIACIFVMSYTRLDCKD